MSIGDRILKSFWLTWLVVIVVFVIGMAAVVAIMIGGLAFLNWFVGWQFTPIVVIVGLVLSGSAYIANDIYQAERGKR